MEVPELHKFFARKPCVTAALSNWKKIKSQIIEMCLGLAKTYILRGTPRTYAIETRAVTHNLTIKKGPVRGIEGLQGETDGPERGTEGPLTGTGPLLIIAKTPR